MRTQNVSWRLTAIRLHLWWITGALGCIGFVLVMLFTPQSRSDNTLTLFIVKLLPFLLLCIALSVFPNKSKSIYPLLLLPSIGFLGYLFPHINYLYYFKNGTDAEDAAFYSGMYTLMFPGILLSVVAAYRIGGGTAGRCIKLSLSLLLVLFSGFVDIMWYLVNPVGGIPDEVDAPHITMLTGQPISYNSTIVFLLVHVVVIIGLNLLPLDKWFARLLSPVQHGH